MADAEAISEAASRANMRFVPVKSAEKQASAIAFKTRDLLVRQRSQMINALRGHAGEFGFIAPQGIAHASQLATWIRSSDCSLPEAARAMCLILVEMIDRLSEQIGHLNVEIANRARRDETSRCLMTIPGFGPIIATAVETMAPPASVFKRGRDFAAWMELTPRQNSSGGKIRLGRTSKMGHRDLRRLLIIGASAVVRWAVRQKEKTNPWLARMLERKPPMLVIMALCQQNGAHRLGANGERRRLSAQPWSSGDRLRHLLSVLGARRLCEKVS